MNHHHLFSDTASDSHIPDSIGIVRAWLDIPDPVPPAPSSSCDGDKHDIDDIDDQQPYQQQNNSPTHSPTPSHCRHSVLPNLVPSPPPVRPLCSTSRNRNRRLPSTLYSNHIRPILWDHRPQQHSLPSMFPISHPTQQHLPGPIFLVPPARLLIETCADTPSTLWPAGRLPVAPTAPETRASTSGPSQATGSATIAVDSSTFVRNLSSTISTGGKRKRSYTSQSITSATSDIRTKRRAMQRLSPPLSFVFGPMACPPQFVALFLARFDMARIEYGCIPWTPGVEALLLAHNPLAYYPPHARNADISEADEPHALALATWAISVYGLIISCTERAQDEATWSAPVRQLLSLMPPTQGSCVPIPPPVVACDQLLTTIDATTKLTRKTILPDYPTVKVDALLAFNPTHLELHSISRDVARNGVMVNALSDPAIDDCIVLLGVEIKAPTGDAAPATAEYQLAVWGAKTLEVARRLGIAGSSDWCDVAVGLTVCGHTWSAYVVFWDVNEDNERSLVVYGPIEVASSANLYGVFKLVAWMAQINVWALEVLECWKSRVADAHQRSLHSAMVGV